MNNLQLIFKPKRDFNTDNIFKAVEEIKEKLDLKQLSPTLFIMALDSYKNQGEIFKLREHKEDKIITDFEKVILV